MVKCITIHALKVPKRRREVLSRPPKLDAPPLYKVAHEVGDRIEVKDTAEGCQNSFNSPYHGSLCCVFTSELQRSLSEDEATISETVQWVRAPATIMNLRFDARTGRPRRTRLDERSFLDVPCIRGDDRPGQPFVNDPKIGIYLDPEVVHITILAHPHDATEREVV